MCSAPHYFYLSHYALSGLSKCTSASLTYVEAIKEIGTIVNDVTTLFEAKHIGQVLACLTRLRNMGDAAKLSAIESNRSHIEEFVDSVQLCEALTVPDP
jgi:hypothetical protein